MSPPTKKRLFIVDDHQIMRQGLEQLINLEPDLTVCGQAINAAQGLAEARRLNPDVAIIDLSLRESSGLDLIKDLRSFLPDLPILVLSMHDELVYAERALRAGARGYVMKHQAFDQVIAAVRNLLRGEIFLSGTIQERMVQRLVVGSRRPMAGEVELTETLSDRELQVFRAIGQGMTTSAVAAALHISVKTVESHRAHIKEKLRIETAPELMRFAVEWARHA